LKDIEVRIPHALAADEVRRRLDRALVHARSEYAEKVGAIDASWRSDEQLDVGITVMGMQIDGQVVIQASELLVTLQVPGMAGMFAGRIRSGIEERIGGLLTGPQV
jgi:hypothetical protein